MYIIALLSALHGTPPSLQKKIPPKAIKLYKFSGCTYMYQTKSILIIFYTVKLFSLQYFHWEQYRISAYACTCSTIFISQESAFFWVHSTFVMIPCFFPVISNNQILFCFSANPTNQAKFWLSLFWLVCIATSFGVTVLFRRTESPSSSHFRELTTSQEWWKWPARTALLVTWWSKKYFNQRALWVFSKILKKN